MEPWAVAADAEGRVLVADPGAPSVRRFAPGGEEDHAFARATASLAPPLGSPRALTLLADGTILVLDHAAPARVIALDADGAYDAEAASAFEQLGSAGTLALAQDGSTTWAAGGDGIASVHGGVVTSRQPHAAAGIAIGCDRRVLLATPSAVLTLVPGSTAACGTLVVAAPGGLEPWDRVRVVLAEPLPPATHLRVWTRSDAAGVTPAPPGSGTGSDEDGPEAPLPTAVGRWRAAPLDVLDVRSLCAEAETLWIGVEWHGDGATSPVVDDIRVDRMGRGWLDELPHTLVAQRHEPLTRLLALLASIYEDVAAGIDRLAGLLDPAVAPDRDDAPWLARLAGWVDVELAQRLDAGARRAMVWDAIAVHGRRGTPRGIVDAVRRDIGVEVAITEPAPAPAWPLGGKGSALSFGSALVAAPADPPVLDAGAVIDRSWLIDPDERGLPLLASSAHRFCVLVPAAALSDRALSAAIERVVEREKPAHTAFRLDATPPGATVGTQRVGLGPLTDGSTDALRFDGTDVLGSNSVLRGHQPTDPPTPGRVGISTVVGVPDPERTITHHD